MVQNFYYLLFQKHDKAPVVTLKCDCYIVIAFGV